MAFKNALKNLVAHFGVVWSLLLYIVIVGAVIIGLSLPFILPVYRAFDTAGVFGYISGGFTDFLNDGNFQAVIDGVYTAYTTARSVLHADGKISTLFIFYIVFVINVVFRFILGLYHIPLATVLDGQMSCNARYGFGGKFFSTLALSVRFSFFKMLYTLVWDAAAFFAVYGLGHALGVNIRLAIAAMAVLIFFGALRSSISACWAPCVVSGERGVFGGFIVSAKVFGKRVGSILSTYFVSVTLLVAIAVFITVFTLGVGAVVVAPFCACYMSYLDITEFYNKTGRRYYIDDAVFTPPTDNTLYIAEADGEFIDE